LPEEAAAESAGRREIASNVHWLGLVIVTLLAAAVQTSLAGWMEVQGARPSFLFIVAMFYGMHQPMVQAGIAGWALGLAGDLTSQGPMGIQSLTLALAAMAASRLRGLIVVENPIVQLLVTGLLCWASYSVIIGCNAWRDGRAGWSLGRSVTAAAWTAGYTALLTPYLFWLLRRVSHLLALPPGRRRR